MLPRIIRNYVSEKTIYFIVMFALTLWFMCKNLDVAFMLFAVILFACSLSPVVNKLSKKMSRVMATTLVLATVFIVSSIFILPILYLSGYQIGSFAMAFPKYLSNLHSTIIDLPLLKNVNIFNTDSIMNSVASSSTNIITGLGSFISSISSTFIYLFTAVIILFLLLVDETLVKENCLKLLPYEMRERTSQLIDNIGEKLGGYVVAQIIVSGSVWITMTAGLLLCGIDYAILLGLIAGVLSLIPVIGSAISLVICLIATWQAGWVTLVVITLLFTASHFVENHVVRPWVYSKFLNLHPIIIFLALFVGAKYAGVAGVIFAPPLVMAMCIIIEELYTPKMDEGNPALMENPVPVGVCVDDSSENKE